LRLLGEEVRFLSCLNTRKSFATTYSYAHVILKCSENVITGSYVVPCFFEKGVLSLGGHALLTPESKENVASSELNDYVSQEPTSFYGEEVRKQALFWMIEW